MMTETSYLSEYAPRQVRFSPYDDNGGSIVAVAGPDFAVIGSDTRLITGFSIHSRDQTKLIPLSDKTVLASSGCWADALQLNKQISASLQHYKHTHNKTMSTTAIAQMLSTTLYYKRFFPYSLSNIVAGLDSDGKGCVFSYDPIGHFERSTFKAGGSAGALLQPLLDNQIGYLNMKNVVPVDLSMERAVNIVKDVFISAAERDIQTGDSLHLMIISKDGSKSENFDLRRD